MTFLCPYCGTNMLFKKRALGKLLWKCPSCDTGITVFLSLDVIPGRIEDSTLDAYLNSVVVLLSPEDM